MTDSLFSHLMPESILDVHCELAEIAENYVRDEIECDEHECEHGCTVDAVSDSCTLAMVCAVIDMAGERQLP